MRWIVPALAFATVGSGCVSKKALEAAQQKVAEQEQLLYGAPDMEDTQAKLSYSIGVTIAQNLRQQGIDSINSNALAAAIRDSYNDNDTTLLTVSEAEATWQDYVKNKQQKLMDEKIKKGEAFLAENGKRSEVTTLPSGLQYEVMKEGTGAKPSATDRVTTHYHGTLLDGTVFDSSVQRGQPATFGVNQVIQGWVEALQLMPEGSKWKLYLPYNLAYGERGAGGAIGPFETLIFEVELLSIVK